jgi:hypothetical protein
MKRWLKLSGILLFTAGFVLAATYDRPNCSGIACSIPIPALELSSVYIENGKSVNAYVLAFEGNCSEESYEVISADGHVWFQRRGYLYVANRMRHFGVFYVPGCRKNLTLYAVSTYFSGLAPPNVTYDGHFVFISDYLLNLSEFYITASGLIGFNVGNRLSIFYSPDFYRLEAIYKKGILRVEDVLYQRNLSGIEIRQGTRVSELVIYDKPEEYLQARNCTEHYAELVRKCKARSPPEYQLPLGLALTVLGFGLFWLGVRL